MTVQDRSPDAAAAPAGQSRAMGMLLAGVGIAGALAAASCCALPVVLFTLGIGGFWIAKLTALGPYQAIFATVSLLSLAGGFFALRRGARANASICAPGTVCALSRSERFARLGLWIGAGLIVLALGFPHLVSHLE